MCDHNRETVNLALGRIFMLLSRPFEEGDEEKYWQARNIVLDLAPEPGPDTTPNWIRDRTKGAQGD